MPCAGLRDHLGASPSRIGGFGLQGGIDEVAVGTAKQASTHIRRQRVSKFGVIGFFRGRDFDSSLVRAASNGGPCERIAVNRNTVSNALEMQREADARHLGFQVHEDAARIVG